VFDFCVKARCPNTNARVGVFRTPHGLVETPRFMPVGTNATVKGISASQLEKTQAQMILANTFHLHLQPGESVINEAGGIHKFMGWNGPVLTDSGGFQVFSLADLNQVNDDGVSFRNPRNGDQIHLTPEKAIQIQMKLGSDVAMAFDQCPPYSSNQNLVEEASERTHHWLERSIQKHSKTDQALFGIVQGGCFPHLRVKSAEIVSQFDLPGIAIGGVSVGEPIDEMHKIVKLVAPLLCDTKPRYLMGIGTFHEMAVAVANGIDLFDCVIPTRLGRHGTALVRGEKWNLKNACFRNDHQPIDSSCNCEACTNHSRAYIHHLIRSGELLGLTLLSLHNITNLLRFTNAIKQSIIQGCFSEDFAPWHSCSKAHHTW